MNSSQRWLTVLLFLACCLLSFPAQAQRQVVITIDDLPYVGPPDTSAAAMQCTEALLVASEAHRIEATVFVTGRRLEIAGDDELGRDLLRRWRDAGHRLENHGWGHLAYNRTAIPEYLADVTRGRRLVEDILQEREDSAAVHFFRAPFNQTGPTEKKRAALLNELDRHDVSLAPFTVEHADYVFSALYADAMAQGDSARARRIGQAYLDHLDTAFTYVEGLSRDTFGREIPQVFLIHANMINAAYLERMLARLRQRGYRFVKLETAIQDPAYSTPDGYVGPWGISWLHRWREGLDEESRLREAPDPPSWIMEAYRAMRDQ